MKVVFIGASNFGLKCFKTLLKIKQCEVVGAITAPKNFKISYNPNGVKNFLHANLKDYCRSIEVPCYEITTGMKDESLFKKIQRLKPDIFIVVGWYHMVPRNWRDLAPAYGMHASLLPKYSGGAPLVWSIINGEKQTGITLFKFSDGVDDGPILGQYKTPIYAKDDIASVYKRIELLGTKLLRKYLPILSEGKHKLITQNEDFRSLYPQRSPEDGLIDWNKSTRDVYNFIRAQTSPYPGAFSCLSGKKVTIWSGRSSRLKDTHNIKSGEIIKKNSNVYVKTGDGFYVVKEIQYKKSKYSGKKLREFFQKNECYFSN